jgi:hypothetical protein
MEKLKVAAVKLLEVDDEATVKQALSQMLTR